MNKRRLYFWTTLLFGLMIMGIVTNRPNVFSAAVIFLIGFFVMKIILSRYEDHEAIRPVSIILMVSLLFLLKVAYPYPKFRTLGIAPDEKAVLFMKEHLAPGSLVFAEAPGPVWTARMNFRPLDFRFREKNEQDILSCFNYFYAKAVYINYALRYYEPGLVEKIERLVGKGLEVGFRSEHGEVEVLLVNKKFLEY
jgi:hypothetical protein